MIKIELSSKKPKNGKKYFKAILHEIYPDDCVVNETGTEYNENGVTYLEKYTKMHLDSIEDMSITVEFINDERTEIYGHGLTDYEDGIPIFRNATMIGNFTNGFIETVEMNGAQKKVCSAEGYFDYMRYKDFIDILEERISNGEQPQGSVEFAKKPDKEEIGYLYGWKEHGRIPVDYDYTGYALLAIRPSDQVATVVEINESKNKEEHVMDEKQMEQLLSSVKTAVAETNSKNAEYETKISELNASIEVKDKEIVELNEKIEGAEKAASEKEKELAETNAFVERVKNELNECRRENAINELNSALEKFTDDEKKVAEAEINSFREDFTKVEINSIVTKINAEIGAKAKEAQILEINSAKSQPKVDDIFGFVDEADSKDIVIDLDSIFE